MSKKKYYPIHPHEHALYKDSFATGNGELYKVIVDIKNAAQDCCSIVFWLTKARSSMPLGAINIVSDILFSELYEMRVFSFY